MSGKAIGKNFDLGYAGNVSRDRDNIKSGKTRGRRHIIWAGCCIE